RAGQPVASTENAPGQQRRQPKPGGHATPEHAQRMAIIRLLAQPGVQNADDQQGLDAFTPDDEHGLAHGASPAGWPAGGIDRSVEIETLTVQTTGTTWR